MMWPSRMERVSSATGSVMSSPSTSTVYGSMDGAMKFVKGDAIAGLIIVCVNLLGGILIGTLQKSMTASDAMRVYSILTIGDGLIAQIPALFISVAAGMIVTRVTTGEGPSN